MPARNGGPATHIHASSSMRGHLARAWHAVLSVSMGGVTKTRQPRIWEAIEEGAQYLSTPQTLLYHTTPLTVKQPGCTARRALRVTSVHDWVHCGARVRRCADTSSCGWLAHPTFVYGGCASPAWSLNCPASINAPNCFASCRLPTMVWRYVCIHAAPSCRCCFLQHAAISLACLLACRSTCEEQRGRFPSSKRGRGCEQRGRPCAR